MPRGGSRPGSGRKPGKGNDPAKVNARMKKLVQQAKVIAAADLKPLEAMLYLMSFWMNQLAREQRRMEPDGTAPPDVLKNMMAIMKEARLYMVAAAPYCHARLASVTVRQQPFDYSQLTTDDLIALERITAKATGAGPGWDQGGPPTTAH